MSAVDCAWRAGDCGGEARHLLAVNFSSSVWTRPFQQTRIMPACDRCAAIFDPALGAWSGYTDAFISRAPIGAT